MSKEEAVEKVVNGSAETIEIVNSVLRGLLTEAGKLKDFTIDQLPDVVTQFLQWRFYMHLAECILPSILLVVIGYFSYKGWKHGMSIAKGYTERTVFCDNEGYTIGFWVMAILSMVVGLALFFTNINLKWLQILVAPKIYLIEYVVSIAK